MKKILTLVLVLILCLAMSGVALAKAPDLTVKDYVTGDTISWIQFKLHHMNKLTKEVDTVWISPLQDEDIALLNSAAEAAYPGKTAKEIGVIGMSGWDTQDGEPYIFDYFGPFTAKVSDPDVHKGDKVAVFVYNGQDQGVQKIDATNVKNGSFKFKEHSNDDDMEADCVYVILHKNK